MAPESLALDWASCSRAGLCFPHRQYMTPASNSGLLPRRILQRLKGTSFQRYDPEVNASSRIKAAFPTAQSRITTPSQAPNATHRSSGAHTEREKTPIAHKSLTHPAPRPTGPLQTVAPPETQATSAHAGWSRAHSWAGTYRYRRMSRGEPPPHCHSD